MSDIHWLYEDPFMLAATRHNMLLACFLGPSQARHIVELTKAYAQLLKTFPSGVGTLVLLPSRLGGEALTKAPRPDEEVSRAAVEAIRKFGSKVLGLAIVLDETGLAANIKRSMAAAMLLMARHHNTHVYGNVDEAQTWLAQRMQSSKEMRWSVAEVQDTAEDFLSQIETRRKKPTV